MISIYIKANQQNQRFMKHSPLANQKLSKWLNKTQQTEKIQKDIWIGEELKLSNKNKNYTHQFRGKINWRLYNDDELQSYKAQEQTRVSIKQLDMDQVSQKNINKSPSQFMLHLLRCQQDRQSFLPQFHLKESEQLIGDLITNRYKLNNYIQDLQLQKKLQPEVVKNYQVLIMLLEHLRKPEISVRHTKGGMKIIFNQSMVQKQIIEIQRLQLEKRRKQQEIKKMVRQYEQVIQKFTNTIQHILQQIQKKEKST